MSESIPPIKLCISDIVPVDIQKLAPERPIETLHTENHLKQDPSSTFIDGQSSQKLQSTGVSHANPNHMDQTNLELNPELDAASPQKQLSDKKPELQPKSQGLFNQIKKRKLIISGIVLGGLILVGISVFLVIYFSKLKSGGSSRSFKCEDFPDTCIGVSGNVQYYVTSTFTDPDQARSVLQVARALNSLPVNSSTEIPRQNLTDIFRDVTKSVECMYFNMPETYMEAFETVSSLQLTTQTQIESYLNMLESFSGQPLKLTNSFELEQTCKFEISETGRRRLLQQATTPRAGNACVANATRLMIYFSGIGYSPSSIVESIYKTQLILLGNSNATYDAGVVALGAWRSDGNLGFHNDVITSYESYLQNNSQHVPSRLQICSALRLILNVCRSRSLIASEGLALLAESLLPFFIEQSLLSFINNENQYELERHKNFVIQQISEGKKVTFAAHAEGAYYASKVYNLLSESQKSHVSLVYIAPMVSSMPDGSSSYITNPNDIMIRAIRMLSSINPVIPNPLAANVEGMNFSSEVDLGLNHELTGYATAYKDKLLDLIVEAMFRTVQPVAEWGNGPITITLGWTGMSDMDLYVEQPSGRMVYYRSKQGQSGYLDRDSTGPYYPQHYYSYCNLTTGDYRVKVHRFHMLVQGRVQVAVMAGSEYLLRQYNLSDINLVEICTINVAYNYRTRSYKYTIYPN